MAKKDLVSADKTADAVEATEKKAEKASKKAKKDSSAKSGAKKGNVFKRFKNWCHDLKVEFKKVIWPDKTTVAKQTSVVLAVIVIFSLFIGLLDEGLLKLMEVLLGLGK
jgi:preprotein translocase subunit SecE